jgi:hypothetical protein
MRKVLKGRVAFPVDDCERRWRLVKVATNKMSCYKVLGPLFEMAIRRIGSWPLSVNLVLNEQCLRSRSCSDSAFGLSWSF